jgi:MOSC domain-containing protein YiiM
MASAKLLSFDELQAGWDHIRRSPSDRGRVECIVRRPATLQREVIAQAQLDLTLGLLGDNWKERGYRKSPDGSAHPDMQITVMNARVIALLAQTQDRWALAGDQLYVDLDLSVDNLPPGTRLAIGAAVIEVTAEPHTGCRQFSDRFGVDATRFVNSPEGKHQRLRGLNAKVLQAGTVRVGDVAIKQAFTS